eukprot:1011678-Rhodomonas_salina.1
MWSNGSPGASMCTKVAVDDSPAHTTRSSRLGPSASRHTLSASRSGLLSSRSAPVTSPTLQRTGATLGRYVLRGSSVPAPRMKASRYMTRIEASTCATPSCYTQDGPR